MTKAREPSRPAIDAGLRNTARRRTGEEFEAATEALRVANEDLRSRNEALQSARWTSAIPNPAAPQ